MSESGHDEDDKDKEYVPERGENDDDATDTERKTSSKRRSKVWDHFKECGLFYGQCHYCDGVFSCKSTVTNLKTHLRVKHGLDLRGDVPDKLRPNYEPASSKREKKSMSWKYLDIEDLTRNSGYDSEGSTVKFSAAIYRQFDHEGDDAKCTICKEVVASSMETMKAHLEENHAKVFDSIIDNAQKSLDSDNDDGDLFTEVVYLEDETPRPRRKIANKRRTSTKEYIAVKSPKEFMTVKSPEEEKTPDEMEMFINYIRCLLKKVPKESTSKLQLDIINLIITAQNKPQQSVAVPENVSQFQNGGPSNMQKIIALPVSNLMPQQDKMYISLPKMYVSNNINDISTGAVNTSAQSPTNVNDN